MIFKKKQAKYQTFTKSLQKIRQKNMQTILDKSKLAKLSSIVNNKCNLCNRTFISALALQTHSKDCIKSSTIKKQDKIDDSRQKFRIKKKTLKNYSTTQNFTQKLKQYDQQPQKQQDSLKNFNNEQFLVVTNWIKKEEEIDNPIESDEDELEQSANQIMMQSHKLIQKLESTHSQAIEKDFDLFITADNKQEDKTSTNYTVKQLLQQIQRFKKQEYSTKLCQIAELIKRTNFKANYSTEHLDYYKEQLQQICDIITSLSASKVVQKYKSIGANIINTIVGQLQPQKLQLNVPTLHSKQQLSEQELDIKFPKQMNRQFAICGVCSSSIEFGQQYRKIKCKHKFHLQCLRQYLPKCPSCSE